MAVLPARVAGVAFVFVPMLLARRLQFDWKAAPFIIVIALGEVFGNVSYVFGARESVAIASWSSPASSPPSPRSPRSSSSANASPEASAPASSRSPAGSRY